MSLLMTSGCGYLSFYSRQATWRKMFENQPRMSFIKRFAPEDSLLVTGKMFDVDQARGPLLLVAASSQYRQNEIVALTTVRDPFEGYTLFLPAGDYGFFVFADLNGNGLFERNELVGRDTLAVEKPNREDGVVAGPLIPIDYSQPGKTEFRVRVRVSNPNYVYPSLDDEFFDGGYGKEGLYNPAALMAHTQGYLFGLEDYDESKTMVLFVHGIGGTPRDWKYFVEGLDRKRFQPFFLYYPSGMPLDKLGALLAQVISSLDEGSHDRGHRIVLAAHSMGGLVALSALQQLAQDDFPPSLALYCSFSTPYGGVESARTGVENAPIVVPVWKDIASGSEFLQKLHQQPFPAKLPFYLFFTYNDPSTFNLGESSDGSVTLSSQLAPGMQTSAIKVLGFNEDHGSFLNSKAGRDTFLKLLDRVRPRKERTGNKGGSAVRSTTPTGTASSS
jgi:pimeloyl-ACP methyl ester carboxylesterase